MPKFNNEVLIARAIITTEEEVVLDPQFHRLFQSDTIPVGRTVVRFPIHDHELSVDLTRFQEFYPAVKVDISSNAIEEY